MASFSTSSWQKLQQLGWKNKIGLTGILFLVITYLFIKPWLNTHKKPIWHTPVRGQVISAFGDRHGKHHGVDIKVKKGEPIRAARTGTVIYASRMNKYGLIAILDHHDGFQTRYAHLHRLAVNKGDQRQQGDLIGFAGESGNAKGIHLHFEIRLKGQPVDPQAFLTINK